MQFQTLLPAILFAQSSFAYQCCFEFVGVQGNYYYAEFLQSGGLQVWRPYGINHPGCEIMINKSGINCGAWRWSMAQNTCPGDRPFQHIGVTYEKFRCV
ncbi:hypothetical protein EG327_009924 [Venturia inaequalis]|uniref:Uncharacterized protein n=1 Tax=Venturia inaequalis TaxID=5025 RepID=A0A8H3UL64_VENIN|nr:hypothetical protein EG327_009924 [Venturia inaequalis]